LFTIALKTSIPEKRYVLTVSNSGKPFPEGVSLDAPETLGLRLISALVEQLGGSIELCRKPFPVFTILFPMPVS
jgi:two-component sensor histidine kinase